MRDLNPKPHLPSNPLEFAGERDGGSLVPSRPRIPFKDETALVLELLQVKNETELDRFLGELVKQAWKGAGSVGDKITAPLGVLLKTVAKKALPSVATVAAGTFSSGRSGDAIARNLGSLVSQALETEVAEVTANDPHVEQCRQLLEKYMHFVRFAGKAAMAAASAPPGADPIAAAKESLIASAKTKLERRQAAPAGSRATFPERVPAIAAMKRAAAVDRTVGQSSRTKAKLPDERICSVCELPPGSCQCSKTGRTGRWFRSGSSIVVNC